MDAERIRAFLLTLPYVCETTQWGGLVFWVGDKAIGGKMFAMVPLEQKNSPSRVISYAAGLERYAELLETEGIFPAPYTARIHWVAVEQWSIFRTPGWERELRAAHALTFAKFPSRTRTVLAMPDSTETFHRQGKKFLAVKLRCL